MSTEFYDLTLESIKAKFIAFLQAQDEFKDYNFEGSALNSLIGLLSYGIQYDTFYLNMVANELFINSAEISDNIKKSANMLNYLPRRKKAASIDVTVTRKEILKLDVTATGGAVGGGITSDNGDPGTGTILEINSDDVYVIIEVDSGTFAATDTVTYVGGGTGVINTVTDFTSTTIPRATEFTFGSITLSTIEDINITAAGTTSFKLYEGTWMTEVMTGDGTDFQFEELAYTNNIDNDNILVTYNNALNGTADELNLLNKEVRNLDNKLNYYLEHLDKLYVKFDDGTLTVKPLTGDSVDIEYLYTTGATGNGVTAASVTTTYAPTYGTLVYALVTTTTENGTDEETDAGIKLNAPLYYTTQGRAVTQNDYNVLINNYSQIETLKDVYLWGGQDEIVHTATGNIVEVDGGADDDLDLGFVYISALKSDLSYLSTSEINEIKSYLNDFKILTIFYRFLHSNIIKIIPSIDVELVSLFNVDDNINTLKTNINTWFDDLVGLNKTFYLSNLVNYIDDHEIVKHTKVSVTTKAEVRNDTSEFYKVMRLGQASVVDSINGTINDETLDESAGVISLTNTQVLTVDTVSGADVGGLMVQETFGAIGIIKKIDTLRDKISFVNVQKIVLGGGEGAGFSVGDWISSDNASPGKGRVELISTDTLYIRVISGTFAATDDVDAAEIFATTVGTIASVASGTWNGSNDIEYDVDTFATADATPSALNEIGTINPTTGFIILDGYHFGDTDDDVISFNFVYSDTSKITLEKESFMNYDSSYNIGVLN
jgi:hypothetical protein